MFENLYYSIKYLFFDKNDALKYAAINNNLYLVKWLIENGANIHINGNAPLSGSVYYGNIEIVKLLIKKGADVNDASVYYYSVLDLSVQKNHLEITKLLIKEGANIHDCDNYVLKLTVFRRYDDIVKLLLQEGADIKVLCEKDQIKYRKYSTIRLVLFLLDFQYKRETEFSKNNLADYNILSIVFSYI